MPGFPRWSPLSLCWHNLAMSETLRSEHDVTRLLGEYAEGRVESLDRIIAIVYEELRGLARSQLRRSSIHGQVQTTMLVNEAYEKLASGKVQQLADRRHFYAIASRSMRQIVVDHYRAQQTAKRGGDASFQTLTANLMKGGDDPARVLAVDQALQTLSAHDPDLAETVDLACFGGLSNEEIAELQSSTVRTVQRKLKRARAWLAHFLDET
jgi:RNA polymerase sigma factor (TIGR02999 family)